MNYLLLNAPDDYYGGYSWYGMPPNQLPGILRSRKLLTEVFKQTELEGYPPERTFLLGFSQGCLMTLEFWSRHVPALAGYIGISGYCYDPEALLRELNPAVNNGNWFISHGLDDEMLSVEKTRQQIRQLNDGGFRIEYHEYPKTHTIDPRREIPDLRHWLNNRLNP